MDFNVREYKVFIDTISDIALQLVLKKLSYDFWYNIKEYFHNYLKSF